MTTPINSIPYVSRIAPTPSGYLHEGHARTFYINAMRAKQRGGSLVLRIEDLDPQRCKKKYIQACLDDLHWMGIPVEGTPVYQSTRGAFYLEAWNKLKAMGVIYPCSLSRKDVHRASVAPHAREEAQELVFPEHLRPKPGIEQNYETPGKGGVHWRFRVPYGKTLRFFDGFLGEQAFIAGEDFGDFVVWRVDDVPAYELAVVVDDALMGITEVVRGEDLLRSTARQCLLYEALGWNPPHFFHVPLLTDTHGRRLAKRDGDQSLKSRRELGVHFDDVCAAWKKKDPGLFTRLYEA